MISIDKKPSEDGQLKRQDASEKPFVKRNIIFMGISLLMIIIGFVLMAGPGSTVEGGFNPDIFSTRRIVVGPTIAFLGFLAMAVAIVYSPKKKDGK